MIARPLAQSMAEATAHGDQAVAACWLARPRAAARTAASVGLGGVWSNTVTGRSTRASRAFCSTPAARTPASVDDQGTTDAHAFALGGKLADGAELELDLGEVQDGGHGAVSG